MQLVTLIGHAREIETLFSNYLQVIYGARNDTLKIIYSLEAVVLNIDLLNAATTAGSPGKGKDGPKPMAEQVRTLAQTALSAAHDTMSMIQANIPKAQAGATKTMELVRLAQGGTATGNDYDSLILALTEIKTAARQVEEDAVRCMDAARALLPQVESLQSRLLGMLPRENLSEAGKSKKIAGRKPGFSLAVIQGGR